MFCFTLCTHLLPCCALMTSLFLYISSQLQTSGKLLDLYRTGGPVTTWKIQGLQVLQHFYRTSFFSKIKVPIEGLPTRFFLPDRRTGTAMVFNSPPLFSPVEDRGPVNFPMSATVYLRLWIIHTMPRPQNIQLYFIQTISLHLYVLHINRFCPQFV